MHMIEIVRELNDRSVGTVYERTKAMGFDVLPAPRLNPENKLDEPFVLRNKHGKIIMRGKSRDDLEQKMLKRFGRSFMEYANWIEKNF